MVDPGGRGIISMMQKKWMTISISSDFMLSLSIVSVLSTLLYKFGGVPFYWGGLGLAICLPVFLLIHKPWQITEKEVSRLLNRIFPGLEESSGLLLKPYDSLNLLEKLQSDKIERVIEDIRIPVSWQRRIRLSFFTLLAAVIICLVVIASPIDLNNAITNQNSVPLRQPDSFLAEYMPAALAAVSIRITPPSYTGKAAREQLGFNLQVEENAEVVWHINTTKYVKELHLIFNDKKAIGLNALNKNHTSWSVNKRMNETGFYQLKIDNNLSELYTLETIQDQPPVIKVQSPKPYVVIDFGEPQQVIMQVALSDDYGLASTNIMATISSGSGEGVKFKEQQLAFANFNAGKQQYHLSKLINLPALGLQPGDELYYYVKATDNNQQESRSDIYIIVIPDTAKLMSLEGLTTGINLVPEYFRSQRQIIIETEQLLKERDTIPLQQFNNRSNNLGLDQQLLRLRYGKFLGEEFDNEIGTEAHEGHEKEPDLQKTTNDAGNFGNASAIMDEYTHKHDNAEDASFFEPELKAQLKATLSEMWKSELQLRTYKPQQALPFEYKALRLLKDLQQKSRVYVAKTSYKTTPLKPENRLSGNLGKIIEPVITNQLFKDNDQWESLRMAIPLLHNLRTGIALKNEELLALNRASGELGRLGALNPAIYLGPVAAMRRIVDHATDLENIRPGDVQLVENAIQKILPVPSKLPVATVASPASNLSAQYFKNLNRPRQ